MLKIRLLETCRTINCVMFVLVPTSGNKAFAFISVLQPKQIVINEMWNTDRRRLKFCSLIARFTFYSGFIFFFKKRWTMSFTSRLLTSQTLFVDDTHLMSYNCVSYDVIQYLVSIQIMENIVYELAMNFNRCMFWGLRGEARWRPNPGRPKPNLKNLLLCLIIEVAFSLHDHESRVKCWREEEKNQLSKSGWEIWKKL